MMTGHGFVRFVMRKLMNTIMPITKADPFATTVQMSRHNYEARPIWNKGVKQGDQLLSLQAIELHRDNMAFVKYSIIRELIDNPDKIKEYLPKGFVRTNADVFELLALFMRYDTQASTFFTEQDAV